MHIYKQLWQTHYVITSGINMKFIQLPSGRYFHTTANDMGCSIVRQLSHQSVLTKYPPHRNKTVIRSILIHNYVLYVCSAPCLQQEVNAHVVFYCLIYAWMLYISLHVMPEIINNNIEYFISFHYLVQSDVDKSGENI